MLGFEIGDSWIVERLIPSCNNPDDSKLKSCGWLLAQKSKSMINCNELLVVASKNDVNKKFSGHKFRTQSSEGRAGGGGGNRAAKIYAGWVNLWPHERRVYGSLHLHLNLDATSCRALEMRSPLCSVVWSRFEEAESHAIRGESASSA